MRDILDTLLESGWLIPVCIVVLFAGLLIFIWLLPFIYRHVDQVKIGSNEIKFRPFPPPDVPNIQDLISEIKSWKENESTDKELMSSIVDRFCELRVDLFYSAMTMSLLLTAMVRSDVQSGLGKDKEKIMGSLYGQLDYTIGKYFLLKKAIIALAKTINKEKQIQRKLESFEETDIGKSILEFHQQVPNKYKKFDPQKFLEDPEKFLEEAKKKIS